MVRILIVLGLFLGSAASASALEVAKLRCEFKENPFGIDVLQPRLGWIVTSSARGAVQSAYQIQVASAPEALAEGQGDRWDSGKVASNATNNIEYAGKPLTSRSACYWRVRVWDGADQVSAWSAPASWRMGLLQPEDWAAQWIQYETAAENEDPELLLPPSPYLRKGFTVAKPVKRATLYASALGLFEASINGQRVGDAYFTPGWTNYNKRVYYCSYDVSDLIVEGANALGAILSNGWYAGYVGFGLLQNRGKAGRAFYGDTAAFLGQLEIEYADGSRAVIASDESWRAATGPIRGNDIQMGESYDARREIPGWNAPGFDDSAWKAPQVLPSYNGELEAYPGVAIRCFEEITPVAITEPEQGVYVFNLGQNFAGKARLKVQGPKGTKVVLRFGEMLHSDGRLMTENLRRARTTDTYTLKGEGVEIWEPRFTYHGFQYVEVRGYPGTPGMDAITGIVMHSDTPLAGRFTCDNAMVNQLFSNINWTQKANFFEVPTDCPQRDERLGWTGDAQIYVRSATCNRDVAAFFTKWLVDLDDDQRPSGAFPDFAPLPYLQEEPSPAWMDAGIICPYTMYQVYGDTRIIADHYAAYTEFMDYLTKHSEGHLRTPLHHCWGDWLSIGPKTSVDFIATAYYAYDAKLMAAMAAAIGKEADAQKYAALFEDIKAAFAARWLQADGRIKEETQTCYALALYMGLMPEGLEEKAAARLVTLIQENDGHLATGFLGVKHVLPVLAAYGYQEEAFRLLTKTTFPSWGYSVVNGATSIWERWNSYTKEKGLHDPGMNSFSHYAFGAVCEWLYAGVAGIDTEGPGFRRLRLRPCIDGKTLQRVEARYESINGPITSAWKVYDGVLYYTVSIPANTTAAIHLPTTDAAAVSESGAPLAEAAGLRLRQEQGEEVIVEAGSGSYTFTMPFGGRQHKE